eukprot:gnl/MRDRNA2_/MRDRNA2_23883_c0_seq2.p1 gnl/MRDRNA2_/MRDRNA2_23883_c0~~gnl/MRDRNA2_/MRDRNA2_23883_c0_seq2.p1  ORF type:complete len:220 (-),score=36.43 gnl/MRDRNA2_/MRDRNA2_23883_c0_seq2:5-664(-)
MMLSVIFIALACADSVNVTDNLVDELVNKLADRILKVSSLHHADLDDKVLATLAKNHPGKSMGVSRRPSSTRPMFTRPRYALPIPGSSYSVPYSMLPVIRAEDGDASELSAKEQARAAIAEAKAAAKAVQTKPNTPAVYTEEGDAIDAPTVTRNEAITQVVAGLAWTIVGTPLLFAIFNNFNAGSDDDDDGGSMKKSSFLTDINSKVYSGRRQLPSSAP